MPHPIIFAAFRCLPAFDKGTPVALLIFRFAAVIPSARFGLKDTPGILKLFLRAITTSLIHRYDKRERPYCGFSGIAAGIFFYRDFN